MDNDEIGQMILESLINQKNGGGKKTSAEPQEKQARKLQELYERFTEHEDFKAGDLIIPKEGMNIWRDGYKHVMVVLEKLEKPVRGFDMDGEAGETGSPYASLIYDIVAAYVDSKGDFIEHLFDSRRFKKYDVKNKIIRLDRL